MVYRCILPDLFRLDVERGKQRIVFPEGLEMVAFQYGFKGIAYLMADIPQGSVHLPQLRFRIPPFRVRSVAQAEIRFQFPAGGHGTAVLVGIAYLFPCSSTQTLTIWMWVLWVSACL